MNTILTIVDTIITYFTLACWIAYFIVTARAKRKANQQPTQQSAIRKLKGDCNELYDLLELDPFLDEVQEYGKDQYWYEVFDHISDTVTRTCIWSTRYQMWFLYFEGAQAYAERLWLKSSEEVFNDIPQF